MLGRGSREVCGAPSASVSESALGMGGWVGLAAALAGEGARVGRGVCIAAAVPLRWGWKTPATLDVGRSGGAVAVERCRVRGFAGSAALQKREAARGRV